ncbi:Uncharacterised protein [Mycobacteroides abscessus subsp. abscessus]|nr:Uncharacterised protein [Mycobacteroides abscessus subsp. abscessus]
MSQPRSLTTDSSMIISFGPATLRPLTMRWETTLSKELGSMPPTTVR